MKVILDMLKESYYIALPIVLGYIVWILQENKKDAKHQRKAQDKVNEQQELRQKANNQGTLCILRYVLRRLHSEYTIQGSITSKQLSEFYEYYDAYHNLGGNGVVTKMKDDVSELPIDESIGDLSMNAKLYYDYCKYIQKSNNKSSDNKEA